MASNIYVSQSAGAGTNTLVQAAAPNVTWNLSYLMVSFAGPGFGANAKVTIYDGTVAGSVLFAAYLTSPVGSVGTNAKVDLPVTAQGLPSLQASTGNAMTIVVSGYGNNNSIINARFNDGLM